jgi:selenide, water dikinase
MNVRLTQYSHGSGCGCKISPSILGDILKGNMVQPAANLIVGNSDRDDAAAYLLDQDHVLLATTDFFMPVVDDPFDFGRIAATNAISDIYAMGGRPIMALAILGWPVDKLSAEIANQVVAGARAVAADCGISIAGGHSIDAPEPIFGLAVNGLVAASELKRNSTPEPGDLLLLTKPLGIGIHTTALKKGILKPEHSQLATDLMVQANKIGRDLARLPGVHAMTDVTGFGLAGHLLEMITPRNLGANIKFDALPLLPGLAAYIAAGAVPGGTNRNYESFSTSLEGVEEPLRRAIVCDPQTSGGLLVAASPGAIADVKALIEQVTGHDSQAAIIGEIHSSNPGVHII